MDPEIIWTAIISQESGGSLTPNVSHTGAYGPGQIQPQTFKDYALPGERIDNPIDNIAVSKRIINDYYKRYNGDVGKIATAYFSGPGNVSPSNAVPFRENRSDKYKTVASYVSDIKRRVAGMAEPQDKNFDPEAAFGKYETVTPKASAKFDPEASFGQWEKPGIVAQPAQPSGSRIPVPPQEMTPEQLTEYRQGLARAVPNPSNLPPGLPSFLAENYHPIAAAGRTAEAARSQIGQGLKEIIQGQAATGTGNIGMGLLQGTIGSLAAPLFETTGVIGQAIGQPHAAEVANLLPPGFFTKGAATAVMPAARSANQIIKLVGEENIPNVINKLENNPNLSLMDVSQPVKTVAAGLANSPETPTAQSIMRGAYESRTAARKDIVQQAIDNTLGPKINVKEYMDQLKDNVRKVGKQRIDPALADAKPVEAAPIISQLDNVINAPGASKSAVERLSALKDELNSVTKDGVINPQKLHSIQWHLRAEAENLARPMSTGAERNLSKPLFDARQNMVDAIDAASGGKYKPALAGFRDEAHVQDAFDKGFEIFANKKGVEDFPEFWNAWVNQAQPAEVVAAKVGALTAARKQIEAMQGGARRGENILGTTFNREKVASLFGPEQTDKLAGLLEDARNMAETNSLLFQNSKTGLVQAGREYFKPREVGKGGAASGIGAGLLGSILLSGGQFEMGLPALGYAGLKTAQTGIQHLARISDKGTATKFAKLVSASEGPARNELLNILRSHAAASSNKSGNLLPSLVRLAAP